jgi:uncharacterized protein (TIGR00730 family)
MASKAYSLCVLCGSKGGSDPAFAKAAAELGRIIAKHKIRLVYGGGTTGLMGEVARAALAAGGEVVGVMPRFLREREVQQEGLTKLILTETLTERKLMLTQLSDAIAVLPGGFGTLDELTETEILSWRNLNIIQKPIVVIDIQNFFAPFFTLLDHCVRAEFSPSKIKANYKVVKKPEDVLAAAELK